MYKRLVSVVCISTIFLMTGSAQNVLLQDDKLDKQSDKAEKEELHIKYEDKGDIILVIEGDILVLEDDWYQTNPPLRPQRKRDADVNAANQSSDHLWPNKRIPFKYDPLLGASSRMKISDAMRLWQSSTCLSFEHAGFHEVDYLLFKEGNNCESYFGRQGGAQLVLKNDMCSKVGDIAHQIGHALGLWHEHTRPDRDEYIEILYENIEREEDRAYFDIEDRQLFDQVPDVGYDIQSIMHLSPYVFGISTGGEGKEMTIKLREDADLEELNCTNLLPMGQRIELSYKDKLRANLLYSCDVQIAPPTCVLSNGTISTTSMSTSPSSTPAPSTAVPVTTAPFVRLLSGNVVALRFNSGALVMTCSPKCKYLPYDNQAEPCNDCQFQIINHPNISSRKIRSRNTVLLRSIKDQSMWLDCSDPSSCVISKCEEADESDLGTSYVSNCSKHFFDVIGVRRRSGKLLNVRNRLIFRHHSRGGYLNCNDSVNKCSLIQEGECSSNPILPLTDSGNSVCLPPEFTALKISESY